MADLSKYLKNHKTYGKGVNIKYCIFFLASNLQALKRLASFTPGTCRNTLSLHVN
jgi:hypothetical protein